MPNANINKVVLGSDTLVDLTDTTATAADVASGKVFYAASGARTLGTASGSGVTYTTATATIPTSGWSNGSITVNVSAVTSTSDVIVAPAPASIAAWAAAGVYCSAQGAGTLTFTCSTAPTEALTANVMAFEGGNA